MTTSDPSNCTCEWKFQNIAWSSTPSTTDDDQRPARAGQPRQHDRGEHERERAHVEPDDRGADVRATASAPASAAQRAGHDPRVARLAHDVDAEGRGALAVRRGRPAQQPAAADAEAQRHNHERGERDDYGEDVVEVEACAATEAESEQALPRRDEPSFGHRRLAVDRRCPGRGP